MEKKKRLLTSLIAFIEDRRPRRSYSGSSDSRTPSPRPRRRKSFSEQALEAIGFGSKRSSSRHRNDDYDYDGKRSRGHRHHRSRSYSRSRSRNRQRDIENTLKAALTAGAAEAVRARKEPGGWTGEKGKRILTAAIGAGGVDKLLSGHSDKHDTRHLIESALAGLATNRLVNGPRSHSRHRGRNKSQHRGAKDVAATGVLAAAGKSAYDHYRSKSRGRDRHSDYSDDDDSRSRHRPRDAKKRSRSVSDYVSRGLSRLGLDDEPKSSHRSKRHNSPSSSEDDYSDDDYRRRRVGSRSGDGYSKDSRAVGRPRSLSRNAMIPYSQSSLIQHQHKPQLRESHFSSSSDSNSDFGSSTDDEHTSKKLRRRGIVATGLATVATVHAGHSVFQSVQKRYERQKQLQEGEISKDEARKRRTRNNLKDATNVAIAALSIKSAVDEWNEAAHQRAEASSFKEQSKYRAQKREEKNRKGITRTRSHSEGDRSNQTYRPPFCGWNDQRYIEHRSYNHRQRPLLTYNGPTEPT